MVPKYEIAQAVNFSEAIKIGENLSFQAPKISIDDIAFPSIYQGELPEFPKGAILTHKISLQIFAKLNTGSSQGLSEEQETIITALPLYHIFSLTANCLLFTKMGGHNVLITNPKEIYQTL